MEHVTEEVLERYALGHLEECDAAPLEEHLLICEDCQIRLQAMDEYVAAMRVALEELSAERRPVPSRSPSSILNVGQFFKLKRTAAVLAVAASLVILLPMWDGQAEHYDLHLQALRGVEQSIVPAAPAGQPLRLTVDLAGLSQEQEVVLELVDSTGAGVWESTVEAAGTQAAADVDRSLSAGQYWVRVYEPAAPGATRGELLREFGLRVE